MTENAYLAALRHWVESKPGDLFCRQIGAGGEDAISWGDLGADLDRFGAFYGSAGLRSGDQLLIFLRHVPELYGAFFGAMMRGVTPAFMPCSSPRQDPALYWASHTKLLKQIAPAAILTDAATLAEMKEAGLDLGASRLLLVEELPPRGTRDPGAAESVPEEAIALLQHSSGTTGLKKGVALSYRAIAAQVESYGKSIGIGGGDTIVSWLPLYHDMGLIACMITPAYFGTPVVHIDPFHWISRPASLFEAMVAHRGTLCWLPNFAFEHLAATVGRRAAEFDLSGVRAFISCSEPVKAATMDRFAAAFAPAGIAPEALQACYAMAETVFAASQTRIGALPHRFAADPATLEIGSIPAAAGGGAELMETGTPLPELAITTHDEKRALLPEGSVGEIAIAGDFLFTGYNKDEATTADRLVGGRYFSRDIGFLREGRLYVLGRLDDLIIVNGRNIYAHEVETELGRVDGIKRGRAVAVADFDPRLGSQSLLVLAERSGPADNDSAVKRDVVNAIFSVFEVTPRMVHLMEEGALIKTTSGKISRSENLKRYKARTQSGEAT